MKRWKEIIILALIVCAISSIGVAAAEVWNIVISPQNFIVNGSKAEANALNINGYNYIKAAEFAEMLDIDISYNESTNTVAFDKSKSFSGTRIINDNDDIDDISDDSEIERWYTFGINPNIDYDIDEINTGFVLEFTNKSKDGEIVFLMSDFAGEYKTINEIYITDYAVYFSIYQRIEKFGDFYWDLSKNINIRYGERIEEDTPERRESLANVYRVYINGGFISGELEYWQANGHSDYRFVFDKQYRLEDVKTIRVEVGYQGE